MLIRPYHENDGANWDAYVRAHPQGTPFHLTAWKRTVERTFGFAHRGLVAEQDGRICGVLPLFEVSNWVTGHMLISSPFAVYGGACADDGSSAEQLCREACRLAREAGVQFLELRERQQLHGDGFQVKHLYVSFDCELPADPEKLLRQIPKDTRYMIRKGGKAGLTVATGQEHLPAFYEVYAQSVQRLGTPVFPRALFEVLCEEFGREAEITVVQHQGRALAGVLSIRFRDWLLPYYGGSRSEGRALAVNNFLYWEVMKSACERGVRFFDFGRSKVGTGSYFFKTQWHMTERPLPYQFYLVRRKSIPNFSPVNPRFKLATAVWKRLPFSWSKVLGPALVRLFP